MTTSLGRRRNPLPSLLAAIALCASPAAAQQSAAGAQPLDASTAWNAWLGCWAPDDGRARGVVTTASRSSSDSTLVCVIPVPGTGAAEFATVDNGEVVGRVRIDPSGERHERTIDQCSGWESAAWSADRKRIYLQSEFTCPGSIQRRSSGVLTFIPGSQWLDVQGVTIEDRTTTRVRRYRAVELPPATAARLPAEIVGVLERYDGLAARTARSAVAKPLDIEAVIDAARRIDAPVVTTWLVEQAQGFSVNAKDLRRLDAAKVPTPVIDILVALSYPTHFAINRNQGEETPAVAEAPPTNIAYAQRTGASTRTGRDYWVWDPFDLYALDIFGPESFYRLRELYGPTYYYGSYRGYLAYGTRRYVGGAPIVIIPWYAVDDEDQQPTRGRAVPGKGYTRTRSDADDSASGRGARGKSPSAGSTANTNSNPGNGSKSGDVSSPNGSGSSGGQQRKAKPRGGD